MKVETTKNKEVDKSELRFSKTENSALNLNQLKSINSPPQPTNGAFAKILEEAKKDSRNTNQNTAEKKTDEAVSSTESKKETVTDKSEDKVFEKEKGHSKQQGSENKKEDGENPSSSSFLLLQNFSKSASEIPVPPARSILHIADLERIISTIRNESFKNTQQVLISLKNSVLEGLQIRITLTESGNLKAEFLALNKQIKKQLEVRKKELKEIFQSRSLNLTEIQVLTSQNE